MSRRLLIPLVVATLLLSGCTKHENRPPEPPVPPAAWMEELPAKLADDPDYGAQRADIADMVLVPSGVAWIGTERVTNEPHLQREEVDVPGFFIDRTPVTYGQYMQCVRARMCLPPGRNFLPESALPEYPVLVTYELAERYCRWRGKRLPTEYEWEKAARGPEGRPYPWGDASPDEKRGNLCDKNCPMEWAEAVHDDGYKVTSPVGSYPKGAGPLGLLDTVGNVKEWVTPMHELPAGHHVAKGSSWYSPYSQAPLFVRQVWSEGVRLDDKGVRCAADAK